MCTMTLNQDVNFGKEERTSMKPFKPNPQQLKAIDNGCTKLWIPVKHTILTITDETTTFLTLAKEEQTWDLKEYINVFSSLQPNEDYFVQEEFIEDPSQIIYKSDFFQSTQDLEDWTSANEMTEQQSRYKFRVIGVEVKLVQDLTALGFSFLAPHIEDGYVKWHDSQYPDTPYSSNPHGFLVDIERID